TCSAISCCAPACSTTTARADASCAAPTSPRRPPTGSDVMVSHVPSRPLLLLALVVTGITVVEAGSSVGPELPANGTIHGRVTLVDPPADYVRRPDPAALGMPDPPGPTDRRRSVVYLDPAPRAAFDTRDEPRARMDQRNETFVPHV